MLLAADAASYKEQLAELARCTGIAKWQKPKLLTKLGLFREFLRRPVQKSSAKVTRELVWAKSAPPHPGILAYFTASVKLFFEVCRNMDKFGLSGRKMELLLFGAICADLKLLSGHTQKHFTTSWLSY